MLSKAMVESILQVVGGTWKVAKLPNSNEGYSNLPETTLLLLGFVVKIDFSWAGVPNL